MGYPFASIERPPAAHPDDGIRTLLAGARCELFYYRQRVFAAERVSLRDDPSVAQAAIETFSYQRNDIAIANDDGPLPQARCLDADQIKRPRTLHIMARSLGELATVAQYKLPVIVCVFSDSGYGILRFVQSITFDKQGDGVDMPTPDFAALGHAIGLYATSVDTAAQFDREFAFAVERRAPALIAVNMAKLQPPKLNHHPGWHLGSR